MSSHALSRFTALFVLFIALCLPALVFAQDEAQSTQLEISSEPTEAQVLVNGQRIGVTPTTLVLPAGREIELRLEHEGFESASQRVVLSDKRQKIHVTLTVAPSE